LHSGIAILRCYIAYCAYEVIHRGYILVIHSAYIFIDNIIIMGVIKAFMIKSVL